MAMRFFGCTFAMMFVVAGCYVEPVQENQEKRLDNTGHAAKQDKTEAHVGECHFDEGRGCFDAFLSSKRTLNVAGKSFFNADDLGARFGELVTKSAPGEEPQNKPVAHKLRLDTPIDQASFLNGFEYELSGATKRSGRIRSNGVLSLHDLVPGSYDLRISRIVRYTTQITEEGAPLPETRSSCAILFADAGVEIQAGERIWDNLSDFQVQIIGPSCGA